MVESESLVQNRLDLNEMNLTNSQIESLMQLRYPTLLANNNNQMTQENHNQRAPVLQIQQQSGSSQTHSSYSGS
jgi:hypothetical protein